MERTRVIIIGAGAAGLAAAYGASERGAGVLVLEHTPEAGNKLLLTGGGRCNLTNSDMSALHYHGDVAFADRILKSFSSEDCLELMHSIGVETVGLRYRYAEELYYYPKDECSSTVREAFLQALDRRGVKLLTDCVIQAIQTPDDCSIVQNSGDDPVRSCFLIETSRGAYRAEHLIVATGSNAMPVTGSDSSLYPLLKALDIPMHPWLPALVPLKSKSPLLKELAGIRADAEVRLIPEERPDAARAAFGEVQFTQHYISGVPVLQLSRDAAIHLKQGKKAALQLAIQRVNNKNGKLPESVPESFALEISGTAGFDRAQVCSGGVDTAGIDPVTMEYQKITGLYFAGELLNVDGDCGGYNLHFAFGTGLIAGRSAAK